MKANVCVTIHSVVGLSIEQLGELNQLLTLTFGVRPVLILDKNIVECRFTTNDHAHLFRVTEALVVSLALTISTDLWTSVSTDWNEEVQS